MSRYRSMSDEAVDGLAGHTAVAYDLHSDEHLDIWGVSGPELRPAVVAIHGGYWRMLARQDTAFMAKALAQRGIATVTVDYTLAPAATLEEIVRQVRTAVAWLHHHGHEHGVDPASISVLGSSAGAHLASMCAVGGWQDAWSLPRDVVKGAMLLSGLYDLRALLDTPANDWLGLNHERASALSPTLSPAGSAPVVVAVAEHEAPGFMRQSRDFWHHWTTSAPATYRVVPKRNHFDVFLDLADPESHLFADLLMLCSAIV